MINYNPKKKVECDIVVVGGGNAGLCAVLEAKDAGANVLLIEKAPKKLRGGNSRFSGGLFRVSWPEGNEDFEPLLEDSVLKQIELEVEPYSTNDFYNKVLDLSDGLANQVFTEIYVNKSLETMDWMKQQGVQWDIDRNHASQREGKVFCPAGVFLLLAKGDGEGLVEMLYTTVEKKGVEVFYETAAYSLIIDAEGKVCGLIAKDRNGFMQINAKSVILACGGFQADPKSRRQYLGENWDLVKVRGTRFNTGEGIKMCLDIGAQTDGHWGGCHASVVSEDSPMIEAAGAGSERYSYPYGIMVNRNGDRFVDEGMDFQVYTYAKFGKEILKQPGSVAFQIFDAKTIPLLRNDYKEAEKVESNSLEGLAEDLDINPEKFLKTITEYNNAVTDENSFASYKLDGMRTRGLNPDKTNWAQKIDTPPYQAFAVKCGLTMAYGGVKANEKAQVIDNSGHPIEGLYAIGELAGGFFYYNYPSGSGLTRGAVMGRVAAVDAVSKL